MTKVIIREIGKLRNPDITYYRDESQYDIVLIPPMPFRKVRFTKYTYENYQPPWTHYVSKDHTGGAFFESLAEMSGQEVHYHRLPDDPLSGIFDHATVFLNDHAMVTLRLMS